MEGAALREILAVSEFLGLARRFAAIEGWISDIEGYVLYRLARDGEGEGAIVEIGSWMGKSTAWLAAGSLARKREPVHAIDTFEGSAEHQDMAVLREAGTTFHRFSENIERAGVSAHVEPQVASSLQAAAKWDGRPIRLLFIDGDHAYEAVKADLEAWLPFVAPGGYIVLDDVIDAFPGVQRLFAEATAERGPLKRLMGVAKIWVTRKKGA
ncbi:MAG TPA: class I SAM-dependent methyltransferase [Burkholderiales bacterium]|nr:class I SAM-dependent methyltransferase [Burkholderiales bacterium]